MKNGVFLENVLDWCWDGLNYRFYVLVKKDKDFKEQLDCIWNCLLKVVDGFGRFIF